MSLALCWHLQGGSLLCFLNFWSFTSSYIESWLCGRQAGTKWNIPVLVSRHAVVHKGEMSVTLHIEFMGNVKLAITRVLIGEETPLYPGVGLPISVLGPALLF